MRTVPSSYGPKGSRALKERFKPGRMTRAVMNRAAAWFAAAAFITAVAGCQTAATKQRIAAQESLLLSAGFKMVNATTPLQQQQLRDLPPERVSAIQQMGKVFFVYPVPAKAILYVGHNDQYLAYETMAEKQGVVPGGWSAAWGDFDTH